MADKLNDYFSALSDPTRRAVITHLATGPAPVSELHKPHDMALSSFLKHLGKLESAGMIRSEKIGRVRMIHIESIPIAETEEWLRQQRRFWDGRLDRLTALAEHINKENNDG